MFEQHTLTVTDVQEIAVRSFIYRLIGKVGSFVLHFDDLKYSFPTSIVNGRGCFAFDGVIIHYEVTQDGTKLRSSDRNKLETIVLKSLDNYL